MRIFYIEFGFILYDLDFKYLKKIDGYTFYIWSVCRYYFNYNIL